MTEKEKMRNGELYDPRDPELENNRRQARILLREINQAKMEDLELLQKSLYQLIPNAGNGLWIEPPFYCDYGYHIITGRDVYMNFNCCILDVHRVRIGDRVLMGPGVHIYTANHPMDLKTRRSNLEYGQPVSIGDDVWIGGGAIICPGVTVGNNVVIGAGAVVTSHVDDNCLVAGNPARFIKKMN